MLRILKKFAKRSQVVKVRLVSGERTRYLSRGIFLRDLENLDDHKVRQFVKSWLDAALGIEGRFPERSVQIATAVERAPLINLRAVSTSEIRLETNEDLANWLYYSCLGRTYY